MKLTIRNLRFLWSWVPDSFNWIITEFDFSNNNNIIIKIIFFQTAELNYHNLTIIL